MAKLFSPDSMEETTERAFSKRIPAPQPGLFFEGGKRLPGQDSEEII